MAELRALPVPDGLVGERLDAALARLLGLSRTAAADLADAGGVRVDGRTVSKCDRLRAGGWLEIELASPAPVAAPSPSRCPGCGWCTTTTTSSSSTSPSASPRTRARGGPVPRWSAGSPPPGYRIATSGAAERQGVVHRLDVGTSGLMVVAKSEYAYSRLKQAFRDRTVDKTYHALVQGHPDPLVGTIDAPIGRHPTRGLEVGGRRRRQAEHHPLRGARGVPRRPRLVEVHLETGRTHQIRVHFSALRHPCVGDLTYGADPKLAERLGLSRQWLHAVRLGFTHPGTDAWVEFSSPYPADLDIALERLSA